MDDPFASSSGSEAPPPYLGAGQPPGISERMQALMSRAEQEIAEQRQLQALVGEVRQALGTLQDEMRTVAGAETLESVREEVNGVGAEVRASTTLIGERLEAVVRAVGASAQVMQGVGDQLERITELLNQQQQQIGTLTTAVAQQRDELGALPETIGDRTAGPVADVGDQVAAVSGAVSSVSGAVGAVNDDVAALRGRLDDVAVEIRSDAVAALRTMGERIDGAVIALAEALLRPRGGGSAAAPAAPAEPAADASVASESGDEEDAPTTSVMTVPVSPPWAGAANGSTDAPETAEPEVEDESVADEPDEAQAEVETFEVPGVVPDETGDVADTADEDDDEPAEAVETEVAETENEQESVEEVPLDAWPADAGPDAADETPETETSEAETSETEAPETEAPEAETPEAETPEAERPADEPPATWGWDTPVEDVAGERQPDQPGLADDPEESDNPEQQKRRPWWRPGG
ncbi:MAG: hypothetical protein QOE45_1464 [Frankiaceae bacterium]|nr:hypothetical protein [Frankiaceae bacterium]